jgi:hypothetical protein
MGPGEHRPLDEEYWQRPWARALFAGDLFEAIPFGEQPTVLYTPEHGAASGKHFLGEIAFGYGLLITPTCDMTSSTASARPRTRSVRSFPSCRSSSSLRRPARSREVSGFFAAATPSRPTCISHRSRASWPASTSHASFAPRLSPTSYCASLRAASRSSKRRRVAISRSSSPRTGAARRSIPMTSRCMNATKTISSPTAGHQVRTTPRMRKRLIRITPDGRLAQNMT